MNYCQSCAMPLNEENALYGRNQDGSPHHDYCQYCFAKGQFTQDLTLEAMIEQCLTPMLSHNPALTAEQARTMMATMLPQLKRWNNGAAALDLSAEVTPHKLAPFTVYGLHHTGAYSQIGQSFEQLDGWCKAHQVVAASGVAIYYDDPMKVAEADLHSVAAIEAPDNLPADLGDISAIEIEGGLYLCYRYIGDYSGIEGAYQRLYTWLMQQRTYVMAERPSFERYLNCPYETPVHELITDIYVALKE